MQLTIPIATIIPSTRGYPCCSNVSVGVLRPVYQTLSDNFLSETVEHYAHDFCSIQKKMNLNFRDSVFKFVSWWALLPPWGVQGKVSSWLSLWVTVGLPCDHLKATLSVSCCWKVLSVTFGPFPRTNPTFYFSSRYYLACYGEGETDGRTKW